MKNAPPTHPARLPHPAVPLGDLAQFRCLPQRERERVLELLAAFRDIASRPTAEAGACLAAARRRHLGRGWSSRTLANL
jgi:hypothetical protein